MIGHSMSFNNLSVYEFGTAIPIRIVYKSIIAQRIAHSPFARAVSANSDNCISYEIMRRKYQATLHTSSLKSVL